jgi:hypothetical protein
MAAVLQPFCSCLGPSCRGRAVAYRTPSAVASVIRMSQPRTVTCASPTGVVPKEYPTILAGPHAQRPSGSARSSARRSRHIAAAGYLRAFPVLRSALPVLRFRRRCSADHPPRRLRRRRHRRAARTRAVVERRPTSRSSSRSILAAARLACGGPMHSGAWW